ncbi:MAG: 2-hydroxy-3-oxopropionate reductase [uncultured Thermomicrobiales bacterium]|uniref:2-hydroxy-3-oxopropionate reductase n=1 Tax=uncultured Thermomicrobiales bacterium TaxID=1645740 RepID=A0A6J4V7G7_9BACT|nr:MAG: 2-hydroxy-3-oxopropionate reductase [uncultured Thermomicrobiales bacterium]
MATNADRAAEKVGFIGLGIMGQPMALNLAAAGTNLVVWNRSADRCEPLRAAGARVAASPSEVFARAGTVIVMPVNEAATDAVLGRGTAGFGPMLAGRTLVCMGSNAPGYSRGLAAEVRAAGGSYVEAPVSSSRTPAEAGQLVGRLAGEPAGVERVRPLLAPMCRTMVACGPVGNGLLTKLAVNLLLDQMLAALAEAVHFAARHGLDLRTFADAIDAGPMASDVTRVKLPKLVERDFAPQAAMADALNSSRLIAAAAREVGIATPLLDVDPPLFEEGVAGGDGRLDMVAVLRAIEARTAAGAAPGANDAPVGRREAAAQGVPRRPRSPRQAR